MRRRPVPAASATARRADAPPSASARPRRDLRSGRGRGRRTVRSVPHPARGASVASFAYVPPGEHKPGPKLRVQCPSHGRPRRATATSVRDRNTREFHPSARRRRGRRSGRPPRAGRGRYRDRLRRPARRRAGLAARRCRVDPPRRPRRRVRPRQQRGAARRVSSASWTWPSSCPAASATTPRSTARWPPAARGSTSAPPRWRTRSGARRRSRSTASGSPSGSTSRSRRRAPAGRPRLDHGRRRPVGDPGAAGPRRLRPLRRHGRQQGRHAEGPERRPAPCGRRRHAGAGDRLGRDRRGWRTWSRWPRRPLRARTSRARSSGRRCTPGGSPCPRRWPPSRAVRPARTAAS